MGEDGSLLESVTWVIISEDTNFFINLYSEGSTSTTKTTMDLTIRKKILDLLARKKMPETGFLENTLLDSRE